MYESRTDVSAAEVPAAVRAVLASALGPGRARTPRPAGERPARPPVAVLIHRYVPAEASGGGAWDPGRPERAPLIDVQHGRLNLGATETIRRSLENLAARFGPVEIEWAATGDQVTFLQLRPYASPEPPPPWRGWHELDDGTAPEAWHWDAAHNPLPLSRAHAGLVAAVDERCRIGIRQRVLGGYLFWSPDGPQSPERLEPDELSGGAGPPDRGRRPLPGVAAGSPVDRGGAGGLPAAVRAAVRGAAAGGPGRPGGPGGPAAQRTAPGRWRCFRCCCRACNHAPSTAWPWPGG